MRATTNCSAGMGLTNSLAGRDKTFCGVGRCAGGDELRGDGGNDTLFEGQAVALTLGMAVSVEIKTGTRRRLAYFLSPRLQAGQESVRER